MQNFYVYILCSLANSDRMYVGITNNLEKRLQEHNNGDCIYTSTLKPWKLCTYIFFDDKKKKQLLLSAI